MTGPGWPDLGVLQRMIQPQDWTRTVCIIVDEIQTVDKDRARDTLVNFHLHNAGLPFVHLFAGLGDSHDVLQEAGLSRLSMSTRTIHDIGVLAPGEAGKRSRKCWRNSRSPKLGTA